MAGRKPRNSIGIIFTSISERFRDNFFDSLTRAFLKKGYHSTLCLSDGDIELEKYYIKQLSASSDCLIIMSCANDYNTIKDVMPKNIPVIFIFNQLENCPETCILESDYSAIYQGVVSLANQGAKKTAFICTNFDQAFTQDAYKAYCDALTVISPNCDLMENVFTVDDTDSLRPKKLLDNLIAKGYDSIFCSTSTLTSSIIDTMLVYLPENPSIALPVLGYSYADKLLSSRLYANVIIPSYDEIINLTIQQALYLIGHPNTQKRAFLLKGTLHMNQLSLN